MNTHSDEYTDLKERIALGQSASVLMKDTNFFKVITNNYLGLHKQAMIDKLCLYSQTSDEYKECIRELESMSYFENYLNTLIKDGQYASQLLDEYNPMEHDNEL